LKHIATAVLIALCIGVVCFGILAFSGNILIAGSILAAQAAYWGLVIVLGLSFWQWAKAHSEV
jgi:hypothetical protein